MRRQSTIFLVAFSWGGLVVGKIHRVELVGIGEEIRWLGKLLDINCGHLVHLLEFVDVSFKFQRAVQVWTIVRKTRHNMSFRHSLHNWPPT